MRISIQKLNQVTMRRYIMFKKSILALSLVLVVAANTVVSVAAADGTNNYAGGDISQYVSLEEQRDDLLDNPNLTTAQRAKIIDKYEKAVRSMNATTSVRALTRSANVTAKKLDVPFCEQINNYYCGPATTQQTYYYLNNELNNTNYAPTQDQIASSVYTTSSSGTDLEYMKNYLNNAFTQDYFVQWWWGSASTMADSVYQAINDDNSPTILHIRVNSVGNSGWKFVTGGHFVSVVGYDSTCTTFDIVDPFKDGHGISDGAYTVSDDDIFDYHVRMAY